MEHDFKVEEMMPQPALAIRETAAMAEIPAKMQECFCALGQYIGERSVPVAGPPFALYHSWSDAATVMDVGFPVPPGTVGEGRIQAITLPGGRIATGTHIGPYDKIADSYNAMMEWMKAQSLTPAGHMWETYLTDPQMEPDPAKWVTRMFWPVA